MPRKKHPGAVKRQAAYALKLKAVRQFVGGFDDAKWTKLPGTKPRTARTKAKRASELAKVSRIYAKLKPFIQRSYTVAKSRSAKRVAALAEYANVPKVKGLRAVPIATDHPKKTRVAFDKAGRVTVSRGKRYKEVIYKFPKRPKAHKNAKGKFFTPGEHAIEMMKELLPTLKPGLYVLQTRSQMLVPFTADRESLLRIMREFVFRYEKNAPDFIGTLVGVKWLAHTADVAFKRQAEIKAARTEAKRRRLDTRRVTIEREAKRLGKISKRARATGRR